MIANCKGECSANERVYMKYTRGTTPPVFLGFFSSGWFVRTANGEWRRVRVAESLIFPAKGHTKDTLLNFGVDSQRVTRPVTRLATVRGHLEGV